MRELQTVSHKLAPSQSEKAKLGRVNLLELNRMDFSTQQKKDHHNGLLSIRQIFKDKSSTGMLGINQGTTFQ